MLVVQVEDAQGLLRGPPNSPVTMILQRGGKGGEPIVVTLLRAVPGGMAVHPTQSSMPTRASAPLPPQAPPVRASNAEAHLQPTSTPHLSATPTSDLTEMHKALCTEFQNISFLWTDSEHPDPMVLALVEWKDDLLCKKFLPLTMSARSGHQCAAIRLVHVRCLSSRWWTQKSILLRHPPECGPW